MQQNDEKINMVRLHCLWKRCGLPVPVYSGEYEVLLKKYGYTSETLEQKIGGKKSYNDKVLVLDADCAG